MKVSKVFLLTSALFLFLGIFTPVSATTGPTVIVTVNGSENATIIDGEEVQIDWYLDGSLSNCQLKRNGAVIQTIDTSVVPVNAIPGLSEVPPTGASTIYSMSCTGVSDTASVATNPIVSMSLPQGESRITDPTTGVLGEVDVYWDSQFATECSNVWMVQENPDRIYYANLGSEYRSKNQPDGWVRFRGWPHPSIDRTTTFYIECTNIITGASEIGSITLTVVDPPPPVPPVVNIWTNTPVVNPDPLYGYGRADVRFNSVGVSNCFYSAYYANGDLAPNPSGWGQWQSHTVGTFNSIRIATTTDFEVRCTRGAVNLNGVDYPATSTLNRVLVIFDGEGVADRTTLPPVTASATATPNPAYRNAITGTALISVDTTVANADYCYQYAYQFNPVSGLYDIRYDLDGWTLKHTYNRRGNGDRTYVAYIAESTRLEMDCRREYDVNLGTPDERANGTELASVIVLAEDSLIPAPAPVTYMYGNAYRIDRDGIWDNNVSNTGFYKSGSVLRTPAGSVGNSISFPFVHPFGESDTYNIHVSYYDTNDGESTYRLYTESDGLVGGWTTNSMFATGPNPDSGTQEVKAIALGIDLDDGDLITIECDTPTGAEECNFDAVYFGAGNGGSVAVPIDDVDGFTNVPMLWMSENTTYCQNANATVAGVGSYQWYFGNSVRGFLNSSVATTTEFSIKCGRGVDGLTDTSSVLLSLPLVTEIDIQLLVDSGECRDTTTLLMGTAPDGFIAGPDGFCMPAVDLAAESPGRSNGPENNVDGTYDTIDALMVIKNLGPGDLPSGKNISYKATLALMPALLLGDEATGVGYFNGGITATDVDSPTLTRTFANIPFGTHQLCAQVNLDGSPNYPEASTNFANNENCTEITLPVPRPPMDINADREVIRSGQTANINWSVNVTYRLNCTVRGAGGLNQSFDTISTGSGHTDSYTTNPLTSTSEFVFTCTEPITNTTFTENVVVEVVPDFEEI